VNQKRYYFDPVMAERYGLREAVLYEYINFWCKKNEKSGRNYEAGYHWTYGSSTELSKRMPFLTPKQVWLAVKSLEKQGGIVIGRFNKLKYDRTAWYRIKNP
jgi:hypothetical protein